MMNDTETTNDVFHFELVGTGKWGKTIEMGVTCAEPIRALEIAQELHPNREWAIKRSWKVHRDLD